MNRLIPFAVSTFLLTGSASRAEVSLPPLFSDHAVLQKAPDVPIWGKAAPGEQVAVQLGVAKAVGTADQTGRWRVRLNLATSAPGPFELVVTGKNRVVVQDVLVGEVWLASGQSNMEWELRKARGGAETVAQSENNNQREFLVRRVTKGVPADEVEGVWRVAGPKTSGTFSAVAYYFARNIQQTIGSPVGIVHASWGGTPVEAWTSREALESVPDLAAGAKRNVEAFEAFPARGLDYLNSYRAWAKLNGRDTEGSAKIEAVSAGKAGTQWRPFKQTDSLARIGLADGGVFWLRQRLTISEREAGQMPSMLFPITDAFYSVYWNGREIAAAHPEQGRRINHGFWPPGEYFPAGAEWLYLRVEAPAGAVRIGGMRYNDLRELSPDWEIWVEKAFPPLNEKAKQTMPIQPEGAPRGQDTAARLFNGMIAPVIPYAIRGVIWYQGESNSGRGWQYREAFPLMIKDWRQRWGRGDFPFLFCQLANYGQIPTTPTGGWQSWAELRESQTKTLSLPNTAQAILIDLGEEEDVHPRDKASVGERLSRLALARVYGRDVIDSGPVFASMTREEGKIRLRFTNLGGGLVARQLPATYIPISVRPVPKPLVLPAPKSVLQGFIIRGASGDWVWADAMIDGDTVVVWSDAIKEPRDVRYAWSNNPIVNLYNAAGLPAAPFRTDDLPAATLDVKY